MKNYWTLAKGSVTALKVSVYEAEMFKDRNRIDRIKKKVRKFKDK